MNRLVDAGNTVIVVEHDMSLVTQSDWVIDIGPGAGEEGGKVVAEGTPRDVARVKESKTAKYMRKIFERAESPAKLHLSGKSFVN